MECGSSPTQPNNTTKIKKCKTGEVWVHILVYNFEIFFINIVNFVNFSQIPLENFKTKCTQFTRVQRRKNKFYYVMLVKWLRRANIKNKACKNQTSVKQINPKIQVALRSLQ